MKQSSIAQHRVVCVCVKLYRGNCTRCIYSLIRKVYVCFARFTHANCSVTALYSPFFVLTRRQNCKDLQNTKQAKTCNYFDTGNHGFSSCLVFDMKNCLPHDSKTAAQLFIRISCVYIDTGLPRKVNFFFFSFNCWGFFPTLSF